MTIKDLFCKNLHERYGIGGIQWQVPMQAIGIALGILFAFMTIQLNSSINPVHTFIGWLVGWNLFGVIRVAYELYNKWRSK
jgi:prepilin signal peptidase PulO-like enzyme (type II secretory pathway)